MRPMATLVEDVTIFLCLACLIREILLGFDTLPPF